MFFFDFDVLLFGTGIFLSFLTHRSPCGAC
jgi:hypothetical protein